MFFFTKEPKRLLFFIERKRSKRTSDGFTTRLKSQRLYLGWLRNSNTWLDIPDILKQSSPLQATATSSYPVAADVTIS